MSWWHAGEPCGRPYGGLENGAQDDFFWNESQEGCWRSGGRMKAANSSSRSLAITRSSEIPANLEVSSIALFTWLQSVGAEVGWPPSSLGSRTGAKGSPSFLKEEALDGPWFGPSCGEV
jgi:hypothetical protein